MRPEPCPRWRLVREWTGRAGGRAGGDAAGDRSRLGGCPPPGRGDLAADRPGCIARRPSAASSRPRLARCMSTSPRRSRSQSRRVVIPVILFACCARSTSGARLSWCCRRVPRCCWRSVGVLLAYRAAGTLNLPGAVPSQHALPVAVALVLIGLGLMIGRKKALSQIAGLMVMENGVYLAALVATLGLPVAVELGRLLRPAGRGVAARRVRLSHQPDVRHDQYRSPAGSAWLVRPTSSC